MSQIFCSGMVKYAGQAIGLVVAETEEAAVRGAGNVEVEYTNVEKPMLTLSEVLRTAKGRITPLSEAKIDDKYTNGRYRKI
jgi:xanthine dehydrogenase molybdopterin-binding subunit B